MQQLQLWQTFPPSHTFHLAESQALFSLKTKTDHQLQYVERYEVISRTRHTIYFSFADVDAKNLVGILRTVTYWSDRALVIFSKAADLRSWRWWFCSWQFLGCISCQIPSDHLLSMYWLAWTLEKLWEILLNIVINQLINYTVFTPKLFSLNKHTSIHREIDGWKKYHYIINIFRNNQFWYLVDSCVSLCIGNVERVLNS